MERTVGEGHGLDIRVSVAVHNSLREHGIFEIERMDDRFQMAVQGHLKYESIL
jgi:hypothetical protein